MAFSKHRPLRLPATTLLTAGLLCTACGSRSALLDLVETGETTGGNTTTASSGGSGGTTFGSSGGSSATTSQGGTGGAADTIVSAGPDSLYETTTDLQAGEGGLVVVAWIAYPAEKPPFVGYTFSKDSGESFSAPGRIDSPDGLHADEPIVAIAPSGEVFVSWLGLDGSDSTGKKIFLARAAPGEVAFGAPSVVASAAEGASIRRPRLGITELGTLFVTLRRQGANQSGSVARSSDGMTWTESVLPPAKSAGGGTSNATPCRAFDGAAAGRFGIAYSSVGLTAMVLTKDEGATFLDAKHMVESSGKDPRCAVGPEHSYMAFADGAGKNLHVSGNDGSATLVWALGQPGSAVRVSNPAMAADSHGSLELGYQVRISDDDPAGSYSVRRFRGPSTNEILSGKELWQVTLPIHSDPKSPGFMGQYTGIATRGEMAFVSYPDASSGFSHIAIHRMELP